MQILGKLLYCTYDRKRNYFDEKKVWEIAKVDWSRENILWHNNIVRKEPKLENQGRTYISFGASAVADAVKVIKTELGWQ